jgi:hypothetical protein
VDAFLDRLNGLLSAKISVSAGAAFLSEIVGPYEQLFELAGRRLHASKVARAA